MSINSRPSEVYEYRYRDWNGLAWDKGKIKLTEKDKAALHFSKYKDLFGLTDKDIIEANLKDMENDEAPSKKSLIKDYNKPISWKRDSRGNII